MSGTLNKVFLMGNLTRDVEVRNAGSTQVANLGLAVNRKFKTQSGEAKEETTFVDCEAWGRTAEVMAQYLSKGRPVFIEGRLKLDQWDDKDSGQKRSKLKVIVESFQFVDSQQPGSVGDHKHHDGQPQRGSGGKKQREYEPIDEDDIPF